MANADRILFDAMSFVLHIVQSNNFSQNGLNKEASHEIYRRSRESLFAYADAVKTVRHPTRWNAPKGDDTSTVMHARECRDHPKVRNTDYMEVHELIGTSGCSNTPEMWTWTVMGVLETNHGRLVVNPGDWIVEPLPGVYLVYTDAQYRELYL